jgi:hypothetical protein
MSYDDQLILTTRSAEYAAAGMQVFAASVITPDPLKSAAIADYIKACLPPDPGEAWRAVLKTIQSNAAAPSPAPLPRHSAYGSSDRSTSPPVPTPDRWQIGKIPSPEAITCHLLASLVDALIGANPPTSGGQRDDHPFQPRHRWNPDDARRWLGYLACHTRTLGHTRPGLVAASRHDSQLANQAGRGGPHRTFARPASGSRGMGRVR